MLPESDFNYAPEEVKREWEDIYSELQEQGNYRADEWQHFTPQFLDTQTQDFELWDVYELLEEKQNLIRQEKIAQPEANVRIKSTLPITVFFVGDIHHGSVFTNEQLWLSHQQAIMDTPGMYVVFLHNLVDNAIPTKFAHNLLTNTIPPDIQFKSMQKQIKQLDEAGKVLGAIEGDCHEGWSWQTAGVSASNLLYGYDGRSFPVLENGSILTLHVGRKFYRVGLWHKTGPFGSNFNKVHDLLQNRRLGNRRTDVEVAAHRHTSEANNTWVGYRDMMQQVALLRAGTYKGYWPDGNGLHDQFVIDRWGKSGEPPGNSVLLFPYDHQAEATLGFDVSERKHEAIRLALWLELIDKKGDILNLMNGT